MDPQLLEIALAHTCRDEVGAASGVLPVRYRAVSSAPGFTRRRGIERAGSQTQHLVLYRKYRQD